MNSPTRPIFSNHYKVYINHTDAGGIVYHANHLTFFENCRRDWLTSLGFDGYFFDADGAVDETSGQQGKIHFVVNHADVKYKSPLFVDDNLIVTITDVVKNLPVLSSLSIFTEIKMTLTTPKSPPSV